METELSAGSVELWAALGVFLAAYILIFTERIHRTIAALIGAVAMVLVGTFLGFYDQGAALASIDFGTLFLVVGMMVMVAILEGTGATQYLAIKIAQASRGRPFLLLAGLGAFTAGASAFLDNVTTMVLIAPLTISIADILDLSPLPFLTTEAAFAVIGGLATLVGDPANIIIGSGSGFGFVDFLVHLAPVAAAVWLGSLAVFLLIFRDFVRKRPKNVEKLMEIDARKALEDPAGARRMGLVLGVVILLYLAHQWLGLEPATVAMLGAALALVVVRPDVRRILSEVEWSAVFFYGALFVLVGGLEHVGILKELALVFQRFAAGNILIASVILLWGAGILSAVVDNVALVIALVPVLQRLSDLGLPPEHLTPLWWSLAIGAVLGGLATPIGSSATVVTISISERTETPIDARRWMAVGVPAWFVGLSLGTLFVVWGVLSGFYA
ncbi:ArsB/NhaD family transporter [Candidatus Bipolaricaulota bacterium]|nr:ArsB/NhaD family transporter [Candidatus Bipolaricaulota bacterium]